MKQFTLLFSMLLLVGFSYGQCDWSTCATACTACGFAALPTPTFVINNCAGQTYPTPLNTGDTWSSCATFVAALTTVQFLVAGTSNGCNNGTVTNYSWTLTESSSCGTAVLSGTNTSPSLAGLTVGVEYTFCNSFTVPAQLCWAYFGFPYFDWYYGPYCTGCTLFDEYPIFVGADPTLPIELISFIGKVIQTNKVELKWETSTEINNDFFTIEKSKDAVNFEEIGIVDGSGNSNEVNSYNLIDKLLFSGVSYYRLKQTDYDGTTVYSGTISIDFIGGFQDVNIHPNPVNETTQISFNSSLDGYVNFTIYDITGKLIKKQEKSVIEGHNQISLSLSNNLAKGMYFLTIDNGTEASKIKFIKE